MRMRYAVWKWSDSIYTTTDAFALSFRFWVKGNTQLWRHIHEFPNFRHPVLYLLPHESLPGAIQFAAYAAIRSRTTNRMPYPDIWNHPRPFTCFSIFAAYRITHAADAYRVYGILALCCEPAHRVAACAALDGVGSINPPLRVGCDCCRMHAMPYEIGTLLLSFSVCTHYNEGNIICHDISGAYNDDFVATLVKTITWLLKCFEQCIGVCDKPLLNAWTLIIMLENGVLPRKHACLKLRDDPGKTYFTKIIVSTFVETYLPNGILWFDDDSSITRYTRCSVGPI